MFWILCAALVLLAGGYVLLPLFREPKAALDIDLLAETELDRLLDRKTVIYRNLKDLEFEYAMGRLSDADFHRLEADYKNDAAIILAKLDQLGASEGLDEAMEKDIAARKAKLFAASSGRAPEDSAMSLVRRGSHRRQKILRGLRSTIIKNEKKKLSFDFVLACVPACRVFSAERDCGGPAGKRNRSIHHRPLRRAGHRRVGRGNEHHQDRHNRLIGKVSG